MSTFVPCKQSATQSYIHLKLSERFLTDGLGPGFLVSLPLHFWDFSRHVSPEAHIITNEHIYSTYRNVIIEENRYAMVLSVLIQNGTGLVGKKYGHKIWVTKKSGKEMKPD